MNDIITQARKTTRLKCPPPFPPMISEPRGKKAVPPRHLRSENCGRDHGGNTTHTHTQVWNATSRKTVKPLREGEWAHPRPIHTMLQDYLKKSINRMAKPVLSGMWARSVASRSSPVSRHFSSQLARHRRPCRYPCGMRP